MRFPAIADVAKALRSVKPQTGDYPDDTDVFDVRLQVWEDGSWTIHTGDSSFDQDHRGYWGASSIDPKTNCRELARDLIDECRDHHAQCV